jgi:nucleotide-binding universal stress UspA family protein
MGLMAGGAEPMTTISTVLVPVDGSVESLAALPVARGLAHVLGASVTLIHVCDAGLSSDELLDRIQLSSSEIQGTIIEQSTGAPAAAIVQMAAARAAACIVMCSPMRPDDFYPLWTVPGDVLQMASCPVVFVPPSRGRRSWTLRRFALPHDGTPTSAAAIAPAADLAERAGAELIVIHVAMANSRRPVEPGTLTAPRYVDQLHHEWPMWAEEFLGRVRSAGHPVAIKNLRFVVEQGDISAAVLEFARSNACDLIALAWRGRLEPERAQTIRRVLRAASCPVIIFRVQS